MNLFQISSQKFLSAFVITLYVLTAVACRSEDATVQTIQVDDQSGVLLPKALKTALPTNGTLTAYISVDNGKRQTMSINGDNASISLAGLTQGSHSFTIEFEFVFNDNPNIPVLLASAIKTLNLGSGSNTLKVAESDYDTSFDSDGDGQSNLVELANNTNPTDVILSLLFTQVKTFQFNWNTYSNVNHYNLLENPDGSSGFSKVSHIVASEKSFDHVAPLYARVNAQYILQTCYSADDTDCSDSNTVLVSGALAGSIGYVKASNTESDDQFGASVSMAADGNTLAVGANGEASNATGVSSDGSGEDDNTAPDSGAVYVFRRSGTTWTQQAYIKASNADLGDDFGRYVNLAADGNTLAVGALQEDSNATGISSDGSGESDNSASRAGAVYVFSRSGTTWTQQAYIKASNAELGDLFSRSVSLAADGNTLAVGANSEDSNATGVSSDGSGEADNSAANAGAVYVFSRSGTTWTQQAYIKASNTENGDLFGRSVSIAADGNTLVVGASEEDSNATGISSDGSGESDNSAGNAGAVYVFSRNGTTWTQQAYIKASNAESGDFFGRPVGLAADGNTLVVGALDEDSNATGVSSDGNGESDNSASAAGAVYVFSRSGNTWTQQAYIKASNTDASDLFGSAVSLAADGNALAVGVRDEASNVTGISSDGSGESDNFADRAGAVYMFSRSGTTWTQQSYIKASNSDASDRFGRSVSMTADANTLMVGANDEDSNATGVSGDQTDNTASGSGAVYLY